jgi:hypothetical protein
MQRSDERMRALARTIQCPAGEWTPIFRHAFVQLPWLWTITFSSPDGNPIEGIVEERRSSWIFPNAPTQRPLSAVMHFERGWWNTFYRVSIKPTHAVVARID